MKKKKLQPEQPNYEQWKKEFLFDMFKAYNNEPDINKREAIRQCIREYRFENYGIIWSNMPEIEIAKKFEDLENKYIDEKLSKYKIDLNDLAIVSVDTYYNETLHPCVDVALSQIRTSFDKNVSTKFEKCDIWEYAVLSKDRKSFVLLRNFLDKKVQPIEDCYIHNQATVGEMLKAKNCYIEEINPKCYVYGINVPESFKQLNGRYGRFDDRSVRLGVIGLEDLFDDNFRLYRGQMVSKMNERQKLYCQEQDKLHNEFTDRQSFEF